MIRTTPVITMLLLTAIATAAGEPPATYTNPVWAGDFPDPFIIRHGGMFYAYATQNSPDGFQVMQSPDLVHWTHRGVCYRPPWSDGHYWAPEVIEHDGLFHMTYSATNPDTDRHDIGVATAADPLGPFEHRAILVRGDDSNGGVIDSTVFFDADGTPYLLYSEESPRCIVLRPMAADLLGVGDERVELIRPDRPWERGVTEAPTVLLRNGIYHLFFSVGWYQSDKLDACYAVCHATAPSIRGPWTKSPGALLETRVGRVYGPGHQCVIALPGGEVWMAYHGWDDQDEPRYGSNPLGRTMRIDRLRWEGDTPIVEGPTTTPRPAPVSAAGPSADATAADGGDAITLTGWGIDTRDLDAFMAQAAAVGFDALISWSTDPEVLVGLVEAGARHHIGIFSCISPMGGLAKLWAERYPDRPVPWQVMTPDEEAALSFITAGRNRYIIPYQFGGEPVMTNEVLTTRIICFSNEEARELLESQIDAIAAVPGLEGLAFDGFGYQNYQCCHCDRCQAMLAEYAQAHPDLPEDEANVVCFRDALVGYINSLADYARSRRPDIRTAIHIWPVFAPDPLYGNRLDVDYCGQTAAWYMPWPEEKIAEYSRIISDGARDYFPRQQGVGMIGYYDRPGQFPVKDAARVDMELRTMIDNGVRHIQVCSAVDVVRNPEIAEVFTSRCER